VGAVRGVWGGVWVGGRGGGLGVFFFFLVLVGWCVTTPTHPPPHPPTNKKKQPPQHPPPQKKKPNKPPLWRFIPFFTCGGADPSVALPIVTVLHFRTYITIHRSVAAFICVFFPDFYGFPFLRTVIANTPPEPLAIANSKSKVGLRNLSCGLLRGIHIQDFCSWFSTLLAISAAGATSIHDRALYCRTPIPVIPMFHLVQCL